METNETRNDNLNEEATENTENTEQKAEVNGGLFAKIGRLTSAGFAAFIGFFKKIFGKKSDTESTGEATEKVGLFAKIKNFFTGKVNFAGGEESIRGAGMSAIIALRCAKFVKKLIKKIGKACNGKDGEDKDPSALAAIFHTIIKVICVLGCVVFAAAVLYYFVQLLPAIFMALAKIMAIAVIVEVVFMMLGSTTGEYVGAEV